METGVCFAVFKVYAGNWLGNNSASFEEISKITQVCFKRNLFFNFFEVCQAMIFN